mmetsp:Transcript_103938/g.291101  ORF Transcript_103938/g.291101 Transcript_103938/m.291101 type:complete len:254 (-) Transcript_103938:133-894(-)
MQAHLAAAVEALNGQALVEGGPQLPEDRALARRCCPQPQRRDLQRSAQSAMQAAGERCRCDGAAQREGHLVACLEVLPDAVRFGWMLALAGPSNVVRPEQHRPHQRVHGDASPLQQAGALEAVHSPQSEETARPRCGCCGGCPCRGAFSTYRRRIVREVPSAGRVDGELEPKHGRVLGPEELVGRRGVAREGLQKDGVPADQEAPGCRSRHTRGRTRAVKWHTLGLCCIRRCRRRHAADVSTPERVRPSVRPG